MTGFIFPASISSLRKIRSLALSPAGLKPVAAIFAFLPPIIEAIKERNKSKKEPASLEEIEVFEAEIETEEN